MTVRILYFAALRDEAGRAQEECELEAGDTPARLAQRLLGFNRNVFYAVNDEMATADHLLKDGDTVAFVPPMAGG